MVFGKERRKLSLNGLPQSRRAGQAALRRQLSKRELSSVCEKFCYQHLRVLGKVFVIFIRPYYRLTGAARGWRLSQLAVLPWPRFCPNRSALFSSGSLQRACPSSCVTARSRNSLKPVGHFCRSSICRRGLGTALEQITFLSRQPLFQGASHFATTSSACVSP